MSAVSETFRTDDIEKAEEHLRSRYGDVRMQGGTLRYAETIFGDRRFLVSRIEVGGTYAASAEVAGVTIASAARGYRWESGGERGTAETGALFQPGLPLQCVASDAAVDVVMFDHSRLTETARIVYGDDALRVRFDNATPISDAHARAWSSAVRLAVATGDELDNPMVRAATERTLAIAVLESFRLVGDPGERRRNASRQHRVYRRALRFIEDNAARPVTVEDAASAVGVSLRDLQRAFRAHSPRGITAAQHLHQTRISAARDELMATDLLPADLAAVAARWGFSPHRFRQHYLEAYGVDPRGFAPPDDEAGSADAAGRE